MSRFNSMSPRARMSGLTLIELMIAMVAGLIVLGALLAFVSSSLSANTAFTKSIRLMQAMRSVDDFVVDELRRAGFDENAMDYVGDSSAAVTSPFSPIFVSADKSCVIYAYDRQPGTPGQIDAGNGEIRAVRRTTTTGSGGREIGVIEVGESTASITTLACDASGPDYSAYPPGCNTTTGWCALSDPRVVDVASFTVDSTAQAGVSHGTQTIPAASGIKAVRLREYRVRMEGKLVNDPDASRAFDSNVKVRADCLRANASDCALAPGS